MKSNYIWIGLTIALFISTFTLQTIFLILSSISFIIIGYYFTILFKLIIKLIIKSIFQIFDNTLFKLSDNRKRLSNIPSFGFFTNHRK